MTAAASAGLSTAATVIAVVIIAAMTILMLANAVTAAGGVPVITGVAGMTLGGHVGARGFLNGYHEASPRARRDG